MRGRISHIWVPNRAYHHLLTWLEKIKDPIQAWGQASDLADLVNLLSILTFLEYYSLWQYRLWSFQTGDTKLERFSPKNKHTQRKLLNYEFCINGKLSKSAKIWLSKSIFYVKNHLNLSDFFSSKNTNLGAHFLITTIFKSLQFLKWCPIFDSLHLIQLSIISFD